MNRKVFKSQDGSDKFVEVGILNTNNEVIFYKPLKGRMTCVSLYDTGFYTNGDYGEKSYRWLSEVKETEKEIITSVDGVNCSIGYIDHNNSVVFYDQYLEE